MLTLHILCEILHEVTTSLLVTSLLVRTLLGTELPAVEVELSFSFSINISTFLSPLFAHLLLNIFLPNAALHLPSCGWCLFNLMHCGNSKQNISLVSFLHDGVIDAAPLFRLRMLPGLLMYCFQTMCCHHGIVDTREGQQTFYVLCWLLSLWGNALPTTHDSHPLYLTRVTEHHISLIR